MMLQILEEGRLTDSLGRTVDFRNTVIIMTSNVGAHLVRKGAGLGFGNPSDQENYDFEKLKNQMAKNGVPSQALLIPEIIELSSSDRSAILGVAEELAKFGLGIEPFGGDAIAVRETPAILGEVNAEAMIRDILDELEGEGESLLVQARIEAILSRVACHGSIRSGRWMRGEEMNALLREMEATPHSGQCNHGRPTYVELKLSDIERLFGRT